MRNIVLAGQHQENGRLLQLLAEKRMLKELFSYQLVELPGKKIHARKLEPMLQDISPEKALEKADLVIAMEPLSDTMKEYTRECKVIPWEEYVVATPKESIFRASDACLRVAEEWLPDVYQLLVEVMQAGYSLYVSSNDAILDQMLSLTKFRDRKADMKLSLQIQQGADLVREEKRNLLTKIGRQRVSLPKYCLRMLQSYERQNWDKNLHRLPADRNTGMTRLYLTCSRQVRRLTAEEEAVLTALQNNDIETLLSTSRDVLEKATAMCLYETGNDQHVEDLLHTGLARIANYDDVIVSFLGSRRCNLSCKYCFSDHRCEALSTMSDNDMLLLTDMLTADRKNLNLHVDNNLGGEPLLDFQAVKRRHNTMVAYHKDRGCDASFGLLTNGTLLGKDHLPWLRAHIPYVGFSLDGDKETHNKIRRDVHDYPTFDRVSRGIRLLQESDWPVDTGVSTVISRYNMDLLAMQTAIRDGLSVPNIVMKPVRAAAESDFALNYDCMEKLKMGYHKLFDYILKKGAGGDLKPLYTMLQPLDYGARFLLRTFFQDRYIVKRCGSGEHIFSVADDGRVYPCDSFNGTEGHEIANKTEGIHNRHGYRVPMVMDENPEFGCQNCFARYLCGGICQYVQYLNHYEHNDVTKMECELAKFLVEEAILFWEEARAAWTEKQMTQVRDHIIAIGYRPAPKDSFYYAPC